MDLGFITEYVNVVVLGICLCLGFVIKQSLDFVPNKYIPVIMLVLGTVLNLIANYRSISMAVILGGMVSGLASTGLYEAFRNLIGGRKK